MMGDLDLLLNIAIDIQKYIGGEIIKTKESFEYKGNHVAVFNNLEPRQIHISLDLGFTKLFLNYRGGRDHKGRYVAKSFSITNNNLGRGNEFNLDRKTKNNKLFKNGNYFLFLCDVERDWWLCENIKKVYERTNKITKIKDIIKDTV